MRCRGCAADVPAGSFCGRCGCDQSGPQGPGRRWLRPRTFAAAPGESVLRPYLASTLFPQLPAGSRAPFRLALFVAAIAVFGLALLRLPAPGITAAALGLPLLFVLYLRTTGVGHGSCRTALIMAAFLGAGLGTAWVMGTQQWLIPRVPMHAGLSWTNLIDRLARFSTVMALMIVPAAVVRLRRSATRKSLDGFAIGALGALAFTAAATLTRLAPQLTSGLTEHVRPIEGLVVQAGLCGFTVPITAAAAGGMAGMLLWFSHPAPDEVDDRPGWVRFVLALLVAGTLLAQAGLVVVDIAGVTQVWMLLLHIAITLLVLLVLRVALQVALLHEAHDPIDEDKTLCCRQCGLAVPDMAFCPVCGAAKRAAAPTALKPRIGWLLSRWGAVIAATAVTLGAAALTLTPKAPRYMCPPDCGRPVSGLPVERNPRFEAAGGAFSVHYPAEGSAYRITTEPEQVTATRTTGDGGSVRFFSEAAEGRPARDIAKAVVNAIHPDSVFAYEIPNAMVGYQQGYGEIDDYWPQGQTALHNRVRILVMVAVKNDLALIASAVGPFREFGPGSGPGLPSGANLEIAADIGQYVNSFTWRGDPPR